MMASRSAVLPAPRAACVTLLLSKVSRAPADEQDANVSEHVRSVRLTELRRTYACAPFSTILPSGKLELS